MLGSLAWRQVWCLCHFETQDFSMPPCLLEVLAPGTTLPWDSSTFQWRIVGRGHYCIICLCVRNLVPKGPMLFYQNKIISRKLETHPHAVQTCRGWLPTLSLLEEGIVVEIHSWSMNYENLWNVLQILICTVLLSTYINNIESHWYIKLWMKENTQISGTG